MQLWHEVSALVVMIMMVMSMNNDQESTIAFWMEPGII